jgi:putative membrane protein
MAFGFVVARFGLFLRLLAAQQPGAIGHMQGRYDVSNMVGIVLILVGIACIILGAVQHRSYVSTLPPADIPRSHSALYPILLALFLAALGLVLVVYLAI